MAGYVTIALGSGIASVDYAYILSDGTTRRPTSGFYTATSDVGPIYVERIYVASVTYSTDYSAPWKASYNSYFANNSTKPASGSGNVNANLYPTATSQYYPARITLTGTPPETVTLNLKCGEGIASYAINVNGSYYTTISSKSYTPITVTKGATVRTNSVTYEAGWSGVRWWYNSSSSYSYPNTSTTNPDYTITSTYNRWCYFEATTYTQPATPYYYRVRVYKDGVYSGVYADSYVSTTGTPTVTVATARALVEPVSGYTYSYAEASAYCTLSGTTFTLSTSSSATDYRALINLYYVTTTYTYYYRVRLYCDGALVNYSNGSVNSTSSSYGYLSLADAQALFSIGSQYEFSYAAAGNSYASYQSAYQRFQLNDQNNRGYCDLYYVTKTYWQGAGVQSGSTEGVSAAYVNDTYGGAFVAYGGSATWSCTLNTGYVFDGWYDQNGTLYNASQTYTRTNVTDALNLYAKATLRQYTARASSAGFGCCFSSVTVSNSSPTHGSSVTFTANLNSGYTFRGWYNGSGTLVWTGRQYTVTVTGDITLYARADVQWTYAKSSGSSLISAEEWTRLQTYVTERNGATFTYTAIAGDVLRARLYNDTATMIGLSAVFSRGQAIYSSDLNALITAANNL